MLGTLIGASQAIAMDAPTEGQGYACAVLEGVKNHPYAVACTIGTSALAGLGYYAWKLIQKPAAPIIEAIPSPYDVPTKPRQKSSPEWLKARQARLNNKKG